MNKTFEQVLRGADKPRGKRYSIRIIDDLDDHLDISLEDENGKEINDFSVAGNEVTGYED